MDTFIYRKNILHGNETHQLEDKDYFSGEEKRKGGVRSKNDRKSNIIVW